jgi:hypothetical protein
MKRLLGTYTSRFNRRHKLFGHLFSGRYKSLIVDGSGNGYLKSVGDYVHLNPARAKLVAADVPLKSFAWSSWPAYLLARSKRPAWLRVDRLLGAWGIPEDSPAGRQRLERALEERRGLAEGEEFKPIRRGWCVGEEKFREELLAQMSEQMGAEHYGEERAETAEALPFTTSQPRRHAFPRAGLRCALGGAITAAMAGITKLGVPITHGV